MLPGRCLHEVFEARACEVANRIAVCTLDAQITYGELDVLANRLACQLRALGVGPDVLVGLCIDRSIEVIVAVLAILKAGGAYVPIDPDYPSKRIDFMLADSAVNVVVTVSHLAARLGEYRATIICIDEERSLLINTSATQRPSVEVDERNLAYVIYTSGSTGAPKGVLVEHYNVLRLFEQTHHWFQFSKHDTWAFFHSVSFDFSVWEIWGALLYGGCLVSIPYDVTRSPKQFRSWLRARSVTVLNQTPSAFHQLIAADLAGGRVSDFSLRLIIFGGEALNVEMLKPWVARYGNKHPALVNMYGITETTVHVTHKRLKEEYLRGRDLSPIGRPIPDLRIHLLTAGGAPVPDNTPGELCVAGGGVTRGYLNQPELTASRFLPEPNATQGGGRLYYSGDIAILTADGELAYWGRSDDQIKVRGFRIEPREVELCLSRHPEVTSATVTSHDYGGGDVRLLAYVTLKFGLDPTECLIGELTAELAKMAASELPIYMQPSTYFVVPEIPMTAHGKVDREALRQMHISLPPKSGRYSASMTRTEEMLAEIWEEVLQRKGIETMDDFFDLGGTSLALIRIIECVNRRFNLSLDTSAMAEEATVAHLAISVDAQLQNS